MISKQHRFYHRFSVKKIYRNAANVRGDIISLKYVVKQDQPWRAAVVVSAKVSKSAVKRNRMRRRIFEWLRANEEMIPNGAQIIISVFDARVATLQAESLDKKLQQLITGIK